MPTARAETVPAPTIVLPDQHTRWLNGVFDVYRSTLADAPAGECALVEVALAWQMFPQPRAASADVARPGSWHGYRPLLTTSDAAVANRVARLVSELSFAMVNENRDAADGAPLFSVEVPTLRHRLTLRVLTTLWRRTFQQFAVSHSGDVPSATALWRMAILANGVRCDPYRIGIRATAAIAAVLAGAAGWLDVPIRLKRSSRVTLAAIDETEQIRRLLQRTGVAPPILPSRLAATTTG